MDSVHIYKLKISVQKLLATLYSDIHVRTTILVKSHTCSETIFDDLINVKHNCNAYQNNVEVVLCTRVRNVVCEM